MCCNCITSCFIFNWSILFHVSIDSSHNLTILLFTPTSSIDYVKHCQMLPGNQSRLYLNSFSVFCLQSSYIAFDTINWSLHPLLPGQHPFCSSRCLEILLVLIPVRVLYMAVKHAVPVGSWECFKPVVMYLITSRKFPIVNIWEEWGLLLLLFTVLHLTQLYDYGMLIMVPVYTHSPSTQSQSTVWHSLLMANSWHLVASTNVFTFGPLR